MKETEASIGKIISLQKMVDPRGNLSIAEGMRIFLSTFLVFIGHTMYLQVLAVVVMPINIAENSSLLLAVPLLLPSIMDVISNLFS